MSTRNLFTRAALAAALLAAAASVQAATVSECIADVGVAQASILSATTFVNARDQANLSFKADGAVQKLDKAKVADAAQILADMAAKVTALATDEKPKLGAEDAALISGNIATAQACVAQLMTQ